MSSTLSKLSKNADKSFEDKKPNHYNYSRATVDIGTWKN
jgi:hypothetical protein